MDLHIEVPAGPYQDLVEIPKSESSRAICLRVTKARQSQVRRLGTGRNIYCNAQMGSREVKKLCELDAESKSLLQAAVDRFGLSARACYRTLKIARTIADLSQEDKLSSAHVSEAIQYRTLDRKALSY
jgi:magnesium chelatase family protein